MGLTFDLLTRILIGIIYTSRTIYLSSLKLLQQGVVESFIAYDVGDRKTDKNTDQLRREEHKNFQDDNDHTKFTSILLNGSPKEGKKSKNGPKIDTLKLS